MSDLPSSSWTLTARWVFPVDRAPLERGVVVLNGEKIVAVEPHGRLTPDLDLGDAAVLPGLVNAHTHLDLTGMRGLAPPTPHFTDWLKQVIAYRRLRTPEQVQDDIRKGLAECLRLGTTLVGDISGDGSSWDKLADAPLRAVVFREFLGLSKDRASGAWERLDNWLASRAATPTCRPGASPHAPYSVRSSLFFAAGTRGVPVAVHLAETAAEQELLLLRRGPFVPFLRDLGVYDPNGLAEDSDHVLRLLNGLSPTLIVHGNFLSPATAMPANASIVYCPRTHAAFGHPPHPFRDFLARGVRVAIGTDSLASNPDLDVLAEIRFLHRLYPDVPGAVLLRMATLSGAEALGWADETGSLGAGKSADLVVVPLPARNDEPHLLLLDSDLPVRRLLFRGRWMSAR
jgi:cytosine/adenosine deaminase-related metal-dependent hydrolase